MCRFYKRTLFGQVQEGGSLVSRKTRMMNLKKMVEGRKNVILAAEGVVENDCGGVAKQQAEKDKYKVVL